MMRGFFFKNYWPVPIADASFNTRSSDSSGDIGDDGPLIVAVPLTIIHTRKSSEARLAFKGSFFVFLGR